MHYIKIKSRALWLDCILDRFLSSPEKESRPGRSRNPRFPWNLQWWEWGKILGGIGIAVGAFLWVLGYGLPPLAVAVLLHFTLDFTLQSGETASRKGERGRHLIIHALVAGGLPMAVAGLVAGDPAVMLIWTALGAASHYLVDWTRRFGLEGVWVVVWDQACHLLTIVLLVLLF